MKKKFIFAITAVLITALAITTIASAALPGTGWWTSYAVQNIGSRTGSLTMEAYDSASTAPYDSDLFPFEPGKALIYDPGLSVNYPAGNIVGFKSPLPSGFEGSLVLSSDVEISAAAQVSNYKNGSVGTSSGAASGMYQAFSADNAKPELLFPIVKNNWANAKTSFFIQAAGAPATVVMTYNMNDGSSYNQEVTIEANKMYAFDPSVAGVPSTECGTMDFNVSRCFGAAIATSTTSSPIAGVIIEHPFSGSPIGAILSSRALTEEDKDTVLFAPNIKNDYYFAEATAAVMNVGTADALVRATITVTFGPDRGSTYYQDLVIEPGRTQAFSKWLNTLGGMPAGNFGAARIESVTEDEYTAQPLVGSTNHSKFQGKIPMGRARDNHYLYSLSRATASISAPIVKEFSGPFTGGLTVVNVGTSPDTIHFEYYDHNSDVVYRFKTINPVLPGTAVDTGRVSYNEGPRFQKEDGALWNFSDMRNKVFSVIAYSETDQKIVSLTTMYHHFSGFDKFYDMMSYGNLNISIVR